MESWISEGESWEPLPVTTDAELLATLKIMRQAVRACARYDALHNGDLAYYLTNADVSLSNAVTWKEKHPE